MNEATEKVTAKRCAIYTRKSTDEGLDKDYNSLEAQFDACAAYIHSQSGKGWTIVDKHYDDGGYSGISPEPKASREAMPSYGNNCQWPIACDFAIRHPRGFSSSLPSCR